MDTVHGGHHTSAGTGGDEDEEGGVEVDEEPMEAELRLPEYSGPFDDYCAIVLQYGYIAMFASVLPGVTFLAVIEVLLQIRTDR